MTSLIKVDNIAPSAGGTEFSLTRGVAKAWVNFDGTGTVAIRDSENVSSITDNNSGNYTANFINDFDGDDYSANASSADYQCWIGNASSGLVGGSLTIYSSDASGSMNDVDTMTAQAFGDLA